LSRDFAYSEWANLPSVPVVPGLFGDTGVTELFDGTKLIECSNACVGYPSLAPPLDTFGANERKYQALLWQSGSPVSGPLRVFLRRADLSAPLDDFQRSRVIVWPFSWDPDRLAVPVDAITGHETGAVIDDEQMIRELRELRAKYSGTDAPIDDNPLMRQGNFEFVQATRPRSVYSLWFRDVLPFEDAEGGVVLPERDAGGL
jgi:hypothetical protein